MSASEWFFCVESLEFHSVIAKADDNTFFLLYVVRHGKNWVCMFTCILNCYVM